MDVKKRHPLRESTTLPLFNDIHREKLNSVQEFVKIKSWLLLIFSTCLHNQLKLYNLIRSKMFKQGDS